MSVGDSRTSIHALALLLLIACPLRARAGSGGIDLSWDDCGAFGALQKTFACGGSSGRFVIVASAIAGTAMPKLVGHTAVLQVQASGSVLPAWWQLGAGGCRSGTPSAILADFDFTAGGGCADPWGGSAMGGLSYEASYGGANRARIRTVCAIPGSTSISGTDEYAFFKLSIATAGSGSCGGCSEGACIVLDSIELDQTKGAGDYTLTTPISRNWVQWQSGARPADSSGGVCAGAVQTAKTWGGLKSLYH
jgi:hypothetical protein